MLIIREMAKKVPQQFHPNVPRVLDRIWVALRDVRVIVREGGAEAMGRLSRHHRAAREKQMGSYFSNPSRAKRPKRASR